MQIGDTEYVRADGQTALSVKQFKGCGKNWAYVYLWQNFRDTHSSWRLGAGIETSSQVLGWRTSTGNEVWSDGTDTLGVCTQAYGEMKWNGSVYRGWTDTRC
ncbi:hypothetical protein TUSST3_52900 [Streptomyces sp. TUS-ST3]|nr:hypothetical protein TUSST3_52900 [Streptomyces sp. TUS-ST3]